MITRGSNLAKKDVFENLRYFSKDKEAVSKCIFLSHRSADASIVEAVAEYIMNAGFNVYFDKLDELLAKAVREKNASEVTRLIRDAMNKSSHALCFVSSATFDEKSWWVPYEMGSFDAMGKQTKVFRINTGDYSVPDFLKVKDVIETITELNITLDKWSTNGVQSWLASENYKKNGGLYQSFSDHSLRTILKAK